MSVGDACKFLSAIEIHEKIGDKCIKSNGFFNLAQDTSIKIISSDFISSVPTLSYVKKKTTMRLMAKVLNFNKNFYC